MAILRKWLLFSGNDVAVNDDKPRILYVDGIHTEMCFKEIGDISKEFLQSTKPTPFIVCFTIHYLDEEERRNFEAIRHVNQTTNEQLSVKCFIIEIEKKCVWQQDNLCVVLHSHPILPNGEEHEGNMRLINQIVEKMPIDKMEDKFVYSPNRHINIYIPGQKW